VEGGALSNKRGNRNKYEVKESILGENIQYIKYRHVIEADALIFGSEVMLLKSTYL
jgi:hypothetical protein